MVLSSGRGAEAIWSSAQRNAASVLPEPVGRHDQGVAPVAIACHAPTWDGVGVANASANQALATGENAASCAAGVDPDVVIWPVSPTPPTLPPALREAGSILGWSGPMWLDSRPRVQPFWSYHFEMGLLGSLGRGLMRGRCQGVSETAYGSQ